MEEVEVGEVVRHLVEAQLAHGVVDVKFSNFDINYLHRKTGVDHRTVAHALRFFGEAVVLESLRRFQVGWSSAYFWGVCRKVAGGERLSGDAAAAGNSRPASPPASQGET